MKSGDLKRAKRAIRNEVRAARDAMPVDERERASQTIADHVSALGEVESAGSVMVFWSFGSEVDTAPLINALHIRGIRVALPRIVEGNLEPRTYAPGDPVTETAFGAWEPSGGETLDPSVIDVVVTPAVVFDRSGRRVGYGGGFYDRFFPLTRPEALRVGIGFDLQLIDRNLPSAHFDLGLDAVVTESEVLRFRQRSSQRSSQRSRPDA
ncbi:MAG: 5-formyltetrahydrofolate cyclo-ligase [Actinomycetota bacterium]